MPTVFTKMPELADLPRLAPSLGGRQPDTHSPGVRWLPLLILPAIALLARPHLPAWGFMWAMAGAIFLGCKWLTLRTAQSRGVRSGRTRALAYVFVWPGMDAARFLSPSGVALENQVLIRCIAFALGKIALGTVLVFSVPRYLENPLLTGWIGMLGLVLLLHFGLFHLLSVVWRALGVNAPPIMKAPLRSTSVSEFWNRRWNGAFNQLALQFVFRPVARRFGATVATIAAFGVSGLVHELVISLPANAGYGLPTAYFIVQGFGLLTERTELGKRLGLARDWPGRVFTVVVAAAPAFWLFHPPFVQRVILPFMQALGAL